MFLKFCMLNDQGKELTVIKFRYAERKQKFKTLTKIIKIRDARRTLEQWTMQ